MLILYFNASLIYNTAFYHFSQRLHHVPLWLKDSKFHFEDITAWFFWKSACFIWARRCRALAWPICRRNTRTRVEALYYHACIRDIYGHDIVAYIAFSFRWPWRTPRNINDYIDTVSHCHGDMILIDITAWYRCLRLLYHQLFSGFLELMAEFTARYRTQFGLLSAFDWSRLASIFRYTVIEPPSSILLYRLRDCDFFSLSSIGQGRFRWLIVNAFNIMCYYCSYFSNVPFIINII